MITRPCQLFAGNAKPYKTNKKWWSPTSTRATTLCYSKKLGAATGEAKDDEGMASLAQLENFPLMFFKHITNYDKISHCITLQQIKTFGKYPQDLIFVRK